LEKLSSPCNLKFRGYARNHCHTSFTALKLQSRLRPSCRQRRPNNIDFADTCDRWSGVAARLADASFGFRNSNLACRVSVPRFSRHLGEQLALGRALPLAHSENKGDAAIFQGLSAKISGKRAASRMALPSQRY